MCIEYFEGIIIVPAGSFELIVIDQMRYQKLRQWIPQVSAVINSDGEPKIVPMLIPSLKFQSPEAE